MKFKRFLEKKLNKRKQDILKENETFYNKIVGEYYPSTSNDEESKPIFDDTNKKKTINWFFNKLRVLTLIISTCCLLAVIIPVSVVLFGDRQGDSLSNTNDYQSSNLVLKEMSLLPQDSHYNELDTSTSVTFKDSGICAGSLAITKPSQSSGQDSEIDKGIEVPSRPQDSIQDVPIPTVYVAIDTESDDVLYYLLNYSKTIDESSLASDSPLDDGQTEITINAKFYYLINEDYSLPNSILLNTIEKEINNYIVSYSLLTEDNSQSIRAIIDIPEGSIYIEWTMVPAENDVSIFFDFIGKIITIFEVDG